MQKYPYIPKGQCPFIFLKDVWRFSTKQIKCTYIFAQNKWKIARGNKWIFWWLKTLIMMGMAFPQPSVQRNNIVKKY